LGQELAQISIKTSFDGRLLKSILVLLPDNRFLVCINLDITIFNQMQRLGQELSEHGTKNLSENLFKNDWQHKLALAIHAYLAQHSWDFNSLSRQQKKQLIEHLDTMGAFNQKNAASYISKSLNLSRATVFNYLRSWRNN
jgi:predicted transcriptional regulator YheO